MTQDFTSAAEIKYEIPASAAQRYIVTDACHRPAAWNVAVRFRLSGPLQPAYMQTAINRVVDQHEVLRTCFAGSGHQVRQRIADTCFVPLSVFDLGASGSGLDAEVRHISEQEARRPFDLGALPLLRAAIIKTAPDDHILLLTAHHAVCDGWSVGLLAADIMRAYGDVCNNIAFSRNDSALQYADYAVAQHDFASTAEYRAHADFWGGEVAQLGSALSTNLSKASGAGLEAQIHSRLLPLDLTASIHSLARQEDLTFFEVALSAFALSRIRAAGQSQTAFATPVSGRNSPEAEGIIGAFVNYLPVRFAGKPQESLKAFRRAAADSMREWLSHSEFRTEDLLEQNPEALAPVFDHVFICQRDFVPTVEGGGVRLTPIPSVSPGALHAMTFFLVERADGWRASCEVDPTVYSSGDAEAALDGFQEILSAFVEQPEASVAGILGEISALPAGATTATVVELPASQAQQRYWMLDQLQPEQGALHLRIRLHIHGSFDHEIGRRALQLLVDRHEALRTVLVANENGLHQRIYPAGAAVNFEVLDLREQGLSALHPSVAEELRRSSAQTFSSRQQSWMHALVILLNPAEAVLSITLSHAVADGWSCAILLREFYAAYESLSSNTPPQFGPLALQYADVTLHEKEWLESSAMEQRLDWWRSHLPAKLPPAELPADHARPGPPVAGSAVFTLDPMLAAAVRQFAQENGATLFSVYGAALLGLLARYTAQQSFSIVTPFANRSAETERIVGPFATPVLVHAALPPQASFLALLNAFQHHAMTAFENALPLERCVELTSLQSRLGRHAANQLSFFYQSAFVSSATAGGFTATPMPAVATGAAFEWQFAVIDYQTDLRIEFLYDASLWSAESIRRCVQHYERFLGEAIFHPGRAIAAIDIATEEERSIADRAESLPPISRRALGLDAQAREPREVHPVPSSIPPRTDLEKTLVGIWQKVFRTDAIGINDDFFDLGGHSLLLARIQAQLSSAAGYHIVAADIFAAPTIAQLAERLQKAHSRPDEARIFPLHSAGNQPPLFLLSQSMVFRRMVQWLHPDQPVYTVVLQDDDLRSRPLATFEQIAALCVSLIRSARPHGPYRIGGWCVSSWLAYEVARQLQAAGEKVDLLLLVDGWAPGYWRRLGTFKRLAAKSNYYFARARRHARMLARASAPERLAFLQQKWQLMRTAASRSIATMLYFAGLKVEVRIEEQLTFLAQVVFAASRRYNPQPADFPALVFRCEDQPQGTLLPLDLGWGEVLQRKISPVTLPGDHQAIFEDPGAQILAQTVCDFLRLPPFDPSGSNNSGPSQRCESNFPEKSQSAACTFVQT